MWNIATSSAPENSRGSAKKLRAKTSRARWRAASGKRSRSSTSAALTPSSSVNVAGNSTSSRPSAASTSTAASPARSKLGLRATKAARLSGGVRGILAKESWPPPSRTSG
jgi:hypothetical protein